MRQILYIGIVWFHALALCGQEVWTVERCMQYAVAHNHEVRVRQFALDDYRTDRTRAIGALLPSIQGNVGGQYNFGRAIDPETNTYTHVNTFYNSYNLSATLPLFDGLQRYHDLQAARANVLRGRKGVEAERDRVAQAVFKAFIDVLYCRGAIEMATAKREESRLLLRQTRLMAEVGTKGEADVVQMEATLAADDYEVTRQEGLLAQSLLTLKRLMNFPPADTLHIASPAYAPASSALFMNSLDEACASSLPYAAPGEALQPMPLYGLNPTIQEARYQLKWARHQYLSSRGALFPSLSFSAGVSTSYYRQTGRGGSGRSFNEQFRNNAGEYLYATLSIPLFNRLSTLTTLRKQRNQLRQAEENLAYQQDELRRLAEEAATDCANGRKEVEKMMRRVEADSLASRLTIRKYEENLASSIDVQTATVTLLQSKAQLLQCRLTYLYQQKMLAYYREGIFYDDNDKQRR